ncbi:hypothetical protein ACFPRL_02320 [Pseudoclavibacter helvolus]
MPRRPQASRRSRTPSLDSRRRLNARRPGNASSPSCPRACCSVKQPPRSGSTRQ